MSTRLNYAKQSPAFVKSYSDFSFGLREGSTDPTLRDLVLTRVSQLNGCAFCVDMHVKEAKLHGERELRLYHLPIWRESPLFSAKERAGLAWAEALTRLGEDGVSDALYQATLAEFSEKELVDLTFFIIAINGWNRLGVAFRSAPGSLDAVYGLEKAGLN
jgi:AhpD family alkylhydroperoxidase